jgi:hypothetical protein
VDAVRMSGYDCGLAVGTATPGVRPAPTIDASDNEQAINAEGSSKLSVQIRVTGAGSSQYNGVYTMMLSDRHGHVPPDQLSDTPIYVLKRQPCTFPCIACERTSPNSCEWKQPEFWLFVSHSAVVSTGEDSETEITWCIGYRGTVNAVCAYDVNTIKTNDLPPGNGWEERPYGEAYVQGGAPAPTVQCERGCDSLPDDKSSDIVERANKDNEQAINAEGSSHIILAVAIVMFVLTMGAALIMCWQRQRKARRANTVAVASSIAHVVRGRPMAASTQVVSAEVVSGVEVPDMPTVAAQAELLRLSCSGAPVQGVPCNTASRSTSARAEPPPS